MSKLYILTEQQILAAFRAWEVDHRLHPKAHTSSEASRLMDIDEVSASRASAFCGFLQADPRGEKFLRALQKTVDDPFAQGYCRELTEAVNEILDKKVGA